MIYSWEKNMKNNKKLIERIEINPRKLGGKPLIRGTRISLEQILNMLAAGLSREEIIEDLPQLTNEDIRAAVYYASRLLEDFHVYQKDYLSQVELNVAA
jgi:uncharacterized protein (DUF433 family)